MEEPHDSAAPVYPVSPDSTAEVKKTSETGDPSGNQPPSDKKNFRAAIWKTVEKLTPKKIQDVAQVWGGVAVTVGFLIGLVTAFPTGFGASVGLYKLGFMPAGLLGEGYKNPAAVSNKERIRPTTIPYEIQRTPDAPFREIETWLDSDHKERMTLRKLEGSPQVATISSSFENPTEQFDWPLSAKQNYEIYGYALKQSTIGSANFFQVIQVIPDASHKKITLVKLRFNEGDRMFVTIVCVPQPGQSPLAFKDCFEGEPPK